MDVNRSLTVAALKGATALNFNRGPVDDWLPCLGMDRPLAYFLTWHTYGTWLHGDSRGSVDDRHNVFTAPFAPAEDRRELWERNRLRHPPVRLDRSAREIVQNTILAVVSHRGWSALAVHVRTTHAHVVVVSSAPAERVMNDLKAYATRRLREAGLSLSTESVWSRHGSTRYLWDDDQVWHAVTYTIEEQGTLLAPLPHVAEEFRRGP